MEPDQQAIEALLYEMHGERRNVVVVEQQPNAPQGASGAQIRYLLVGSDDERGTRYYDKLVTKDSILLERQILNLLRTQGCAVPPIVIPDLLSEGRALIYMPYLDECPWQADPEDAVMQAVADRLAKIHGANRKQPPAWLPQASPDFLDRLWLRAWHDQWEINMADPEFAAEFGPFTSQLDKSMSQFIGLLETLTAEGETLTLLSVDLIPGYIRLWKGEPVFIDWEQSCYGTLYLDLPNFFTVETALVYRDALARQGYEIPVVDFLERYREVGRYMGLRYLGHSLWVWAQGGEQRKRGRWFLYYTFTLALRGR